MFSLRKKLHDLDQHLPKGFHSGKGIRSLFPSSYTGSIAILNKYVFKYSDTTPADSSAWIAADGAGRWFFAWWNDGEGDINPRFQAGFVFYFSNDGFGHGYADTTGPSPGATSCNAGTDSWIAEHWPQIFAGGLEWDYQHASGFLSLPDRSNIWTDAGFAASKFIALTGSQCACAYPEGCAMFPFADFYLGETAPQAGIPLPFVPEG